MTLIEAVLARLHHLNDWKGPGELAVSVNSHCQLCASIEATVPMVRSALETLTSQGMAVSDGNGKWRAATQWEIDAIKACRDSDETLARRRATVLALAKLLEGTQAGDDLLKVAEGL